MLVLIQCISRIDLHGVVYYVCAMRRVCVSRVDMRCNQYLIYRVSMCDVWYTVIVCGDAPGAPPLVKLRNQRFAGYTYI
jgi:hypothetical protein